MESIWCKTVEITERRSLPGDASADIVVIGAGMAGILTAYLLKEQGRNVIVLEGDRIAGGQTKNTTAKITSQHGLIYNKLIRRYGRKKAQLYAQANEAAIQKYQQIVEQNQIDCDFKRLPAFLYSTQNEALLKKEAEAAAGLGLRASFQEQVLLPFPTAGAVCFENQAQFHPLRFIQGLARHLEIYEKTMVHSVKGHKIYTNCGIVTAEHIVFATHYPFPIIPGFYFIRQHQERSYIIAFSDAGKLEGMYYSIDEQGMSLRNDKELLLIGSGSHRTGKNEAGGKYAAIREQAKQYFPKGKEAAHWSAQDCVTQDGLPLIGAYSVFRPYWYVATGFQKWGMTLSMVSAMIICNEICGISHPYGTLFSPWRWHPLVSLPKLAVDLGTSIKGLAAGYHLFGCGTEENLECGHGGIVRNGFRRYGCYRDEQGSLHRISLRCPHMGCQLLWNPDEKSWDCPCHGSRFDYDGRRMDNPAQKSKKEVTKEQK